MKTNIFKSFVRSSLRPSVMTSSLRISQPPAQWKLEEPRSQAWLYSACLASASHIHAQCLLSPFTLPVCIMAEFCSKSLCFCFLFFLSPGI